MKEERQKVRKKGERIKGKGKSKKEKERKKG